MAITILGKRIVQIIVSARADGGLILRKGRVLETMTVNASAMPGEEAPKLSENNAVAIRAKNIEKITRIFFFLPLPYSLFSSVAVVIDTQTALPRLIPELWSGVFEFGVLMHVEEIDRIERRSGLQRN
jgi:hypothetical protein